jgi:hypothetical protein
MSQNKTLKLVAAAFSVAMTFSQQHLLAAEANGGQPTGQPTVFESLVRKPAPPRRQSRNGGGNNGQSMAPFLQQLANSGAFGGVRGRNGNQSGFVTPGSPNLVPCAGSSLPPHVKEAIEEAMEFRRLCRSANSASGKHIAINDYSLDNNSQPTMYIFTLDGRCEKQTSITWGRGKNGNEYTKPKACADSGSNFTPPGFHLTSEHEGGTEGFDETNSLLMVGLERQRSPGRGILIHGAEVPGTATSLGCTGVGEACLEEVRQTLGYGSLVYNYFGSNENNPECASQAGKRSNRNAESCYAEQTIKPGSPPSGGSTPTAG